MQQRRQVKWWLHLIVKQVQEHFKFVSGTGPISCEGVFVADSIGAQGYKGQENTV